MPRKELLELMHRQRFKVQLGRYLKVWIVIKMCKKMCIPNCFLAMHCDEIAWQ